MIKTLLILIFIVLGNQAQSQAKYPADFKRAPQKSEYKACYRVPADSILHWLKRSSINIDFLNSQQPIIVLPDSVDTDSAYLTIGQYIWVKSMHEDLVASWEQVSDIGIALTNDRFRHQLMVYHTQPTSITHASVKLNNKILSPNTSTKTYLLPKKWKKNFAVIAIENDTLIATIDKGDFNKENRRYYSKRSFRYWPVVRKIRQIPYKVARIFDGTSSYNNSRRVNKKYVTKGFVLFNQPLYKPGDTLKLKAWLTDGKERPLNYPQQLSISYNFNGRFRNMNLGKVAPVTPGSYLFNLHLPDSFPSDTRYTFSFEGKKKPAQLNSSFSIEDYHLPDISTFSWKAIQQDWLYNDTIQFKAEATDASGLPLLDASLELMLITTQVKSWAVDTLFVPDTLYQVKQPMANNGPTTVTVSASKLPAANLDISAVAILRNSNNEQQQRQESIRVFLFKKEIEFTRQGQHLKIDYQENGISIPSKALLEMENDYWAIDTVIQLPCSFAAHPLAEYYTVKVLDNLGRIIAEKDYEADTDRNSPLAPMASPDFVGDSIGFLLMNPAKLQVMLTVSVGKKIIWKAATNEAQYRWYKKASAKTLYHLKYDFINEGISHEKTLQMALPFKWLKVHATSMPVVQPGTTDTLLVSVTDYRNKPMPNVNLTAVAHNLQLSNKLNLPELPLVHQYKRVGTPGRIGETEQNSPSLRTVKTLFPFREIRKAIGVDTLQYYQWLYSSEAIQVQRSIIKNAFSELAVFATKDGVPEPLYAVYVNNLPVWFYMVNSTHAYSQQITPGYAKIAIRTKNALIIKDSVYLQPYFKHEVFINLNQATRDTTFVIKKMPEEITVAEKAQLEQHFIRFEKHDNNQYAWVWQGNRIHQLNNYPNKDWVLGPFETSWRINAFKKNQYQLQFDMEPNFRYRLNNQLVRIERMPLFPEETLLTEAKTSWRISEEIPDIALPPIEETTAKTLHLTRTYFETTKGFATAKLIIEHDSAVDYQVWVPADTSQKSYQILAGNATTIHQLKKGLYYLLLVKEGGRSVKYGPYNILEGGINCIRISRPLFVQRQPVLDSLLNAKDSVEIIVQKPFEFGATDNSTIVSHGTFTLTGFVKDAKTGMGIPGAAVVIKGSKTATTTNELGYYLMSGIGHGDYSLVASTVGYISEEKKIFFRNANEISIDFNLTIQENRLDDVVVVGYGTQKRRVFASASTSLIYNVSGISQMLEGKLAGVQVSGNAGSSGNIQIRGSEQYESSNEPLYVVDGVLMNSLPADLDTIAGNIKLEILAAQAGIALYGSRATHGVVIISTGRNTGPTIRTSFSDYAYWQPNQTTNQNGTARIAIKYPDNITNWQHAVYAAAPRGRYGRSITTTKAFKGLQGQLSVPSFLIEGDSTYIVGKAMNYTQDAVQLSTTFLLNGKSSMQQANIPAMDALTPTFGLVAPTAPDTLKPVFKVADTKGRTDGEERSIPIFSKGTIENNGQFFVMSNKDTIVNWTPAKTNEPVQLYASAKLIDLLERELEGLVAYPYDCLEQTANKLWGLLMMKEIKKATGQTFKYEKRIAPLLNKLLKNQQPNGAWGWWPGYNANLYITTRVLQVLKQVPANANTQLALRNGYLYLQNELPKLARESKIEALYALSQGNHVYPYKMALDSIPFDSMQIHHQWQYYSIAKQHKSFADSLFTKLWQARTESVTGALYWGKSSWYWYNAPKATQVVAWRALQTDSSKQHLMPKLQQFLLEDQQNNGWGNTVERAEISNLLLQEAMRQNDLDLGETRLEIDKQKTITQFPAKITLSPQQNVSIHKSGFGLVYLSLYQSWLNKQPAKVDSLFKIETQLLQQGQQAKQLQAGKNAILQANLYAKKSGEFVMIEIPIPAGCIITSKPQVMGQHREYLKDKVVVFIEKLQKGDLQINVPLEVRYTGTYTINPAKIELMYMPIFFGRNEMKQVEVK